MHNILALTPELIQESVIALRTASERLTSQSDERWIAHGTRAVLRLAEAGHEDFAIMTACTLPQPDLMQSGKPIRLSLIQKYHEQSSDWPGFQAAAGLVFRIAKGSDQNRFPPTDGKGPTIEDIQIAFDVIADHLEGHESPSPPESSVWMNYSEAEKLSGANRGTISKAIKSGKLKSNGLNGKNKVKIDRADLTRWMRERSEKPDPVESDKHVQKLMDAAAKQRNNR